MYVPEWGVGHKAWKRDGSCAFCNQTVIPHWLWDWAYCYTVCDRCTTEWAMPVRLITHKLKLKLKIEWCWFAQIVLSEALISTTLWKLF